jgi:hypothetical protein
LASESTQNQNLNQNRLEWLTMLDLAERNILYREHNIHVVLKYDPKREVFVIKTKAELFMNDFGYYCFRSTSTARNNQEGINEALKIVNAVIDNCIEEKYGQFSELRCADYSDVESETPDRVPGLIKGFYNRNYVNKGLN